MTSARKMGPFPFYLPVLLDISNSIFEVAHSLGGISPVRKIRIENDSWNPKKVWTFCFSPSFCLWCSSALIFMIPICSLGNFHGSDIWPCLPTDSNAVHCFTWTVWADVIKSNVLRAHMQLSGRYFFLIFSHSSDFVFFFRYCGLVPA